jgi:hypothetical protein
MNNNGLFASNTIPIQYYTSSIAIQYNTNTDSILTKFRYDPEKLKNLIIIKNQKNLVCKHLVCET